MTFFGPTGVTDLNGLQNDIYEGVLTIAEEEAVMPALMRPFTDDDGTMPRIFSARPKFEMDIVDEDDDYEAPQKFGKSEIARISPDERMAQARLKWRAMRNDPTLYADAKVAMGMAMARRIDKDAMSIFPSLTGGEGVALGSDSTVFSLDLASAAQLQLTNGDVGGHYAVVTHNYALGSAMKALSPIADPTNVPPSILEAMKSKWYLGSLQNMHFFGTNKLEITNGAVTGAMFAIGDCIAYDERVAPHPLLKENVSDRSTDVFWHADYGIGAMRTAHGIPLRTKAIAPTGT